MAKLMEDEKAMLPDDGVSPIDSENKYFFLDFFGLKRNHIRFLNFFKHENLFDIEKPSYSSTKVWNKEPTLYKESFDEFGHTIDLVEIPPCIFIENDEELMNLMKVSDGNYKFPSSINSTIYNKYTSEGKLLTNLIYLISKPTTETSIIDKNGNTFANANNSYYEFIITSIDYNTSTGMYDLKWEMLGGKESEGGSGSSNTISISETVVISTLPAGSEATASIEELTKTEHLTVYQLHLGIPSGKNGENGKDGTNGIDGKEVQLQVSETSIQWKYDTEEEWKDLITLESLKGPKGDKGDKGEDGTNGIDGKEIELQKTETEIEWKYVTDEDWKSLVLLSDIKGSDGETGPEGPQGIQGETGEKGTDGKSAYEIAKEQGYVGTETEWIKSLKGSDGETGPEGPQGIQGETGPQGDPGKDGIDGTNGKEIELQKTETEIQWRYTGEESWNTLVLLSDIKGEDGTSVNIKNTLTSIDDLPITDVKNGDGYLIDGNLWIFTNTKVEDEKNIKGFTNVGGIQGPQGIQGEKGEKGDKGDPGEKGTDGIDGTNGSDGKSAYEIAKEKGFEGTEDEWLTSLKGKDGKDGITPDTSKFLTKDNTEEFTPTDNYNPVHKKYVDDLIGDINTILSSLTTV